MLGCHIYRKVFVVLCRPEPCNKWLTQQCRAPYTAIYSARSGSPSVIRRLSDCVESNWELGPVEVLGLWVSRSFKAITRNSLSTGKPSGSLAISVGRTSLSVSVHHIIGRRGSTLGRHRAKCLYNIIVIIVIRYGTNRLPDRQVSNNLVFQVVLSGKENIQGRQRKRHPHQNRPRMCVMKTNQPINQSLDFSISIPCSFFLLKSHTKSSFSSFFWPGGYQSVYCDIMMMMMI
ncbi:hypothetical protein F5B21DRAFT_156588 [Xylaria acuta]|nr:hypothetical protein F5B21DRAFT_156588 [Xylaria acuta]